MEGFASAAMMRLVQAGLARQGLGQAAERPAAGPHVPLASKRRGVEQILAAHGPLALLRIGEALEDLTDAPVLTAFEGARSPQEAVDRWRRLEGFAHSRHRTEVLDAQPQAITLRHYSIHDGEPPRLAEDLLIFGVLTALFARAGAANLRARPVDDPGWCFEGGWVAAPQSADCSCWRFTWTAAAPAGPETGGSDLKTLIRANLMRRWSIGDAAKALGVSARTLQRRLRTEGATFSQIVADLRASAAVRMLDNSDMELGEIGFHCGYSDQAHFTRAFKAAIAVAPGAYRKLTEPG